MEPILGGAALGAATAVQTLCAHPDSFRAAVGVSGIYSDAISNVSTLGGAYLAQLKARSIVLGTGAGDYEKPQESEILAEVFRAKGINCRFENWGPGRDHTWSTWCEMLPRLVRQML
jgi:esterase/lipase superfamily enzyme